MIMKLTKTIPATIKINTDLIKRNDIFEVEDTLSCNTNTYIVSEVNQDKVCLVSLTRGESIVIKAEDLDRFEFNKMLLIREDKVKKNEVPLKMNTTNNSQIDRQAEINKKLKDLRYSDEQIKAYRELLGKYIGGVCRG